MRIFIASNNGQVAERLGKCREFVVYDIKDRKVMTREVYENPGRDSETVTNFIILNQADIVIVGGLGQKSMKKLAMIGIRIGIGAKGECDNIIDNLLADESFDLDTVANHYSCDCEDDGCCCCGGHHSHTEYCEGDCCEGDDEECCCGHHDDEEEHHCCGHHHDDEEHHCCHEHDEEEHHCCCGHHHE